MKFVVNIFLQKIRILENSVLGSKLFLSSSDGQKKFILILEKSCLVQKSCLLSSGMRLKDIKFISECTISRCVGRVFTEYSSFSVCGQMKIFQNQTCYLQSEKGSISAEIFFSATTNSIDIGVEETTPTRNFSDFRPTYDIEFELNNQDLPRFRPSRPKKEVNFFSSAFNDDDSHFYSGSDFPQPFKPEIKKPITGTVKPKNNPKSNTQNRTVLPSFNEETDIPKRTLTPDNLSELQDSQQSNKAPNEKIRQPIQWRKGDKPKDLMVDTEFDHDSLRHVTSFIPHANLGDKSQPSSNVPESNSRKSAISSHSIRSQQAVSESYSSFF